MEQWVEEIEGWDDQPFSGGYGGLQDLADRDFSGAVSTGGTWLFMVNGRVVAVVQYRQTREGSEVVDADIERFDDGSGTAYAAPDSSIPLLIAMKTCEGETRGRYYSVKTPVDEVAATLEDGGFTGYVELSENVLSGDYYSVYQAGRSMDLAFIGNARRLLTGEDAHERMVDEVGIYEVTAVDLDVVEIPGDDGAAGAAGAAGAVGAAGAAGAAPSADDAEATPAAEPVDERPAEGPNDETSAGESVASPDSADAVLDEPTATEPEGDGEVPEPADGTPTDEPETASADPTEASAGPDEPTDEPETADDTEPTGTGAEAVASAPSAPGATATPEQEPASPTEGVTNRSIPSLDPSRSGMPADEGPAEAPTDTEPSAGASTDASTPTADPDEMADLREDLRAVREKLADARSELESTREERDALAARVEELQARIEELESGGGSGPALSVAEALAGTNLFVRYDSKSNLTVEDAHEGAGDREELLGNLLLDHHTQFESAGATVDGRPFDDWLASLDRRRFAQWLVGTLLFEIRETGSVEQLGKLYDALPAVDRVELDGSVTVAGEDGEETLGFDLVTRDRMGEPLTVSTIVDSREPVSETAMGELVTSATAVAEAHDSLAGAFYVTSAFFSPEALETAREATSGSLLSRDRRQSYVKLSRNRGYHLGLVESREETFHLSVPDL